MHTCICTHTMYRQVQVHVHVLYYMCSPLNLTSNLIVEIKEKV